MFHRELHCWCLLHNCEMNKASWKFSSDSMWKAFQFQKLMFQFNRLQNNSRCDNRKINKITANMRLNMTPYSVYIYTCNQFSSDSCFISSRWIYGIGRKLLSRREMRKLWKMQMWQLECELISREFLFYRNEKKLTNVFVVKQSNMKM